MAESDKRRRQRRDTIMTRIYIFGLEMFGLNLIFNVCQVNLQVCCKITKVVLKGRCLKTFKSNCLPFI